MATITLTEANFDSTVTADGIVLVDCWAAWCGPCRMFGPIFEAASDEYANLVFGKLDTDAERGIAEQLQIQSIPTILIFRDGILVFRDAGALNRSALLDVIEQVKALDMDEIRAQSAE